MTYVNGSILVRNEPLPDQKYEAGIDEKTQKPIIKKQKHPLNRVEVVAVSPVSAASPALGDWNGLGGSHTIIKPVDTFGANEVAPDAALARDYTIERMGPEELPAEPVLTPIQKQAKLRSPEAVFAQEAADAAAAGNADAIAESNPA